MAIVVKEKPFETQWSAYYEVVKTMIALKKLCKQKIYSFTNSLWHKDAIFCLFFFKQFWSEIPREFRKTQKYLQRKGLPQKNFFTKSI